MKLEEAKDFFLLMNCSKFMMARENPQRYEAYLALYIPKETETIWRKERIANYYEEIKTYKSNVKLWVLYNKMCELTESIKDMASLTIMEDALKSIRSKLKSNERIIVAETINGRKLRSERSGLIYLSFDLGDKVKAKFFASLSLDLLNINSDDKDLISRANNAKLLCNEIINELAI